MLTLRDLLELPLIASARPQILVDGEFDRLEVRWVHTSEIYDIAPLLKGGEVLFTTGLGLVGAGTGSIAGYVEALADRDVTALVVEVGRTFVALPEELIDTARRRRLPLIALHRVVPFVEITELVHPLLVSAEVEGLRAVDGAFRRLTTGLLAGDDLGELVAEVADTLERPVGLYSSGLQLLAGDDVRAETDDVVETTVGPESWAHLVAAGPDSEESRRLLDVAATAVALRLAQKSAGSPSRALAMADLMADIVSGHFLGADDLESRAADLGFVVPAGSRVVALVVDLTHAARTGLSTVSRAARVIFGAHLAAEVEGRIALTVRLRSGARLEEQLRLLLDRIDRELAEAGSGRLIRVTAGPVVGSVAGLASSLPRAGQSARLARRLALTDRVVTERDLGLHDLLTRVVPDAELETFVEQQLGPLLQADARSGNSLVLTLSAYLEAGRSKSAAAELLGVRRQTLYQRLDRISRLLGDIDLSDHDRLIALDLAITAWRMRTSGLTGQRDRPDARHGRASRI